MVQKYSKYLFTAVIVGIAVLSVLIKYWDYVSNPWTRDGQVRAQVIEITPRVSGPIVQLPIKDNQFVKAGDLLFEIDPRTFEANLEQARAELDSAREEVAALEKQITAQESVVEAAAATIKQSESKIKAYTGRVVESRQEYDRQLKLVKTGATSTRAVEQARANWVSYTERKETAEAELLQMQASTSQAIANLAKAKAELGVPGEQNSRVRQAKARLRSAELDLEFTQQRAPVDGYVTNLNIRLGTQAVANRPVLALVDVNSYWIHGFFRENHIADIRVGDQAVVTLMTYPDRPLQGHVDSLGWGISQEDGSTGNALLPSISPTFEWIRLAQRVPVRIHLDEVPEDVKLRVGTTTSVLVKTGTSGSKSDKSAVAAPRALQ